MLILNTCGPSKGSCCTQVCFFEYACTHAYIHVYPHNERYNQMFNKIQTDCGFHHKFTHALAAHSMTSRQSLSVTSVWREIHTTLDHVHQTAVHWTKRRMKRETGPSHHISTDSTSASTSPRLPWLLCPFHWYPLSSSCLLPPFVFFKLAPICCGLWFLTSPPRLLPPPFLISSLLVCLVEQLSCLSIL